MHRYEITYAPRGSSTADEHHSIQVTLSGPEVAVAHAHTRFVGEIPVRITVVATGREVWNRTKGSPYWIHWGTLVRDPYTMNFCSDSDAHMWAGGRDGVNKITHLERDGRLVWEKEAESVRELPKVSPAPLGSDSPTVATHLLLYDDKSTWIYASDDIAAIEYATRPDEICPSHVVRIGGSVIWQAPPPAKKLEPDGGSCQLYPPLPEQMTLPAITPAQEATLRKLLSHMSDRIPPETLPRNSRTRQHVLDQQRDSVEVLEHILSCAVVQEPAPLSPKPYVTIEELDNIVARTRAQRKGPAKEASRRFQRSITDHSQDMLVAEALLVAEGRG